MNNNIYKEDWVECELGEVVKTTSGGTPSRRNPDYYNGTIPWVKSGELDKGLITDTEEKITEEAIRNSSAKIFPKGTLLIALYGATIGKLAFLGIEASTNQAVCGIYKNENIDLKFLYYFLLFKRPKLVEQGIGGAQPNISQTILKNLILPLPPLPLQHAIVKKIEELFSSLDSGIADLKKAQEQLKVYRQAVLKKAFEGEWKKVKLEEVCSKIEKIKRKEVNSKASLKYIDISSINNQSNEIISHKDYLWENAPSRAQQIIYKNDVLFSTVRTYLKNIALITNDKYNNEICSSGFTVLRAEKNKLYFRYLFYYTLYNGFLNKLAKLQTGTSYPAVRNKDVLNQLIPLPSIPEQHQIVKEIESRLSVCDAVEKNISESLEKAESLRQSILKKAFDGTLLTPQEIEQCKQHPGYEPASKLLERIRNKE